MATGYSHNIYIGNIDRLHVVASYFHEAKIGHNLKSRAKENVIENSYFVDGANGTSSYLLDFPDGGIVFMRGNLLHKGPKADNTTAVAYGAERNIWTTNTVTLIHNTLVHTMGRGTFVSFAGVHAAGDADREPLRRQRRAVERHRAGAVGAEEQSHGR